MLRRSTTRRLLHSAAVVSFISALFISSLRVDVRKPTLVRIGDIKPWMSFSYVRVEGILETGALEMKDGSLLCLLADETGSLPVFISTSSEAVRFTTGDPVGFSGRLGLVVDSRTSLRVEDTGEVRIVDSMPPVTVHGTIRDIRSPPPGTRAPHRLLIDRPEGRLEVIHWFTPERQAAVGARLEAEGTLGFYRGRKQLTVRDAGDLRLYPEA